MNTNEAVKAIAELIEENITDIPVLRYERTKKTTGDYIVVNAMQAVFFDAVGTFFCNINIHTKDDIKGEPRAENAFQIAELIAGEGGLFEEPIQLNGFFMSLYSMSGLLRDTDTTHYINVQIEVKFENLTI